MLGLAVEHLSTRLWITLVQPSTGLAGVDYAPISAWAAPLLSANVKLKELSIAFVRRATQMVYLTTYHCEPWSFRLSLLERAFSAPYPDVWNDGLLTARMKCGFCHQRAWRLVSALRAAGIKAEVYGIGGHVIAKVSIDGKDYAADPDYGVGPFLWPDNAAELTKSVIDAYAVTSVPLTYKDRKLFASWYVSPNDNSVYVGLSEKAALQRRVFFVADCFAFLLGLSGIALGILLLRSDNFVLSDSGGIDKHLFAIRSKADPMIGS